jgi:hypothetical protein
MKTRPLSAYEIKVLRRVLVWFHQHERSQRRDEKERPARERESAKSMKRLHLMAERLSQRAGKEKAS